MIEFILGALAGASLWRFLRRTPRDELGLADLLPYAYAASAHTILLKDGGLMTGFRLTLSDLESTSEEERIKKAELLHNALLMLSHEWSIEMNLHRLPVRPYVALTGAAFPTRSLHQLELERAEAFNNHFNNRALVTECILFLVWTPEKQKVDRLFNQIFVKESKSTFSDAFEEVLRRFEQQVRELEETLKAVWNMRRLTLEEILTECHRCLTGYSHPIRIDRSDTYLAPVVASTDMWTGAIVNVGGRYMPVAFISSLGSSVAPDVLRELSETPEVFRVHLRYMPLPKSEVMRRLSIYRNLWHIKFQGFMGMSGRLEKNVPGDEYMTSELARRMLEEMQQVQGLLEEGKVGAGLLSVMLVLSDTNLDQATERMTRLISRLRERGFTIDFERMHATSAFLSTLPGCGGALMRRPIYTSEVAAYTFPLTAPWAGRPTSPNPLLRQGTLAYTPPLMVTQTRGGTPFRLNIHVKDVGHTLIVGGTGGGKSVLVDMICHSFLRYNATRVIILDVDRSHYLFALAAGSKPIDPAYGLSFQPLRYIDDVQERAWAAEFVRMLIELSGGVVGAKENQEIIKALNDLVSSKLRTLTELSTQLSSKLRTALTPYTTGGPLAFFDAPQEKLDFSSRVNVIEIGPFAHADERTFLPLLEFLFHRIERSLSPSQPTLIVVEESWIALSHDFFAQRVREWLFRVRKLGGTVLLVGHSPDQFTGSSAITVSNNCPTRIFVPGTDVKTLQTHYKALGLNDYALKLLEKAVPRKEYLIWQREGVRLFQLALGELEKLMVGIWKNEMERDKMLLHAQELFEKYPDRWLLILRDEFGQEDSYFQNQDKLNDEEEEEEEEEYMGSYEEEDL